MNTSKGLVTYLDRPIVRWPILIFASFFLYWLSKRPIKNTFYEFDRTETVEVISVRSHQNSNFGEWFLLSFKFDDGRVDYISLSDIDTLQAGHMIRVDVIAHPHKKNRYRLAQDPIAP